jgi:hypothetical protein
MKKIAPQKEPMIISISFGFTKGGDGLWPDFSKLPKSKQNIKYIKSCFEFSPNFDEMNKFIEKWEIIDDGLDDLEFVDGDLKGRPRPLVSFILNTRIGKEKFLHGVWTSSYKLQVPSLNDDEPFFFEDHNGYSSVWHATYSRNLK